MKLKLKDILQNADSLRKLLNKDLPIKTAYRLGKLSRALQAELDQFNFTRNELIKNMAEKKMGNIRLILMTKLLWEILIKKLSS